MNVTYNDSFISSAYNGLLRYRSYASKHSVREAAQTGTEMMRLATMEMCCHNLLALLLMLLVKCYHADVVRQCSCQLQQHTQTGTIMMKIICK